MRTRYRTIFIGATLLCAFALPNAALADSIKLKLSGYQEVLPVATLAVGNGTIMVDADHSISGSVTTTGINATMAHIHYARARQNGPVIVPLTKTGENVWSVPADTKLTDAQYAAYKSGELYVNVHSVEHPGGEIRAQILP